MAISKEKVIEYLTGKGYKAINEQGVIVVICNTENTTVHECMIELKKELKQIGYNQSYGVKAKNIKEYKEKE